MNEKQTENTGPWWDIESVITAFALLYNSYNSGGISEEEYRIILEELMFKDMDGNIWTLGTDTGNWFVLQGGQWVVGTPEGPLTNAYKDLAISDKGFEIKPSPAGTSPCTNCGSEMRSGLKFCTKCGNVLESIPEPIPQTPKCPNCDAEVRDDLKFCTKCGAKLKE